MAQKKIMLQPQYDPIFTEFAIADLEGLVVRGARIVVSSALRQKMVTLAYEGHQGIRKTKERTREWYPGSDKMVNAHMQHCYTHAI